MKHDKFRMQISEHPSVVVFTYEVFHLQRPLEQSIEPWSVMDSNCNRRVVTGSYDQTKLKLKQLFEIHLTNTLYEEVKKSTSLIQASVNG